MLQQVIRVGNSAAVTIPKDFLREAKIKIGDQVMVEPNLPSKTLVVRAKKIKRTSPLSEEFISWTDKFVRKYRPLLEELSKK